MTTLRAWLNEKRRDISTLLGVFRQIATGLKSLHKAELHAWLRLETIELRDCEVVSLGERAFARDYEQQRRLVEADAQHLERFYLAPEVARGEPLDQRADFYVFGLLLYEALFGKAALAGFSVESILSGRAAERIPGPEAGVMVPIAGVLGVLDRCLKPDPEQRFADAGQLVEALDRALSGQLLEPQPSPGKVEEEPQSLIGSTVAGYRLAEYLGSDLDWWEFRAQGEGASRASVRLKLSRPEIAADSRPHWRMIREAQVIGRLQHENNLAMLECGEFEGRFYTVSEDHQGRLLSDSIGTRPMSVREATGLIRQINEGLASGHELGFLHRHLSPSQIVMSEGLPKIANWSFPRELCSLESNGTFRGTPALRYLAPERGRLRDLDQRSDLYSLGLIYYALLTGVEPLKECSALEILSGRAHRTIAPPEAHIEGLPRSVRQVLEGLLAVDRDLRYESCAELAADLEAILEGTAEFDDRPPVFWHESRCQSGHGAHVWSLILLFTMAGLLVKYLTFCYFMNL